MACTGMGEGSSGDVGGRLREARERRGMSLAQVARAIRINPAVLDGLERNDISRLPGGIFTRGIVRSYAIEVGLDPETITHDFLAQFPKTSGPAGHPALTVPEDHLAVESERRAATTFVRLIAISVPLGVSLVYFGAAGRPGAVPPATISPSVAATSGAAAADNPEATSGTEAGERLQVVVSAVRAVSAAVTVDGERAFEGTLQPGARHAFEAQREVVLTTGDAAAVLLTINGDAARPLGRDGEIVTVRLDSRNLHEYLGSR
jgi:cytoskeletal protein RodZ